MAKKFLNPSYLLIAILCFVFYGNTLKNHYSLDDVYVIKNNKKVAQGISGIPNIFTSHYIENSSQSYAYRPITLTVFAIEHQFFGENPFVSHLINLLLYIISCLLLLHVLRDLFKHYHWLLPLLVTVLFVIHPLHSEVVNNVKSRDEILSFLFALLALRFALKYVHKYQLKYLLGVLIFMVVSLLSKLSSLTFIAVIPLALYFFKDLKLKPFLAILGVMALSFFLLKIGSGQLVEAEAKARDLLFFENPLFTMDTSLLERIPMAFFTAGYYIKLLVAPFPLLFYYGYDYVPIVGWDSIWAWISILVILPLGIYTIIKFKSKQVLVFGLAYFFITISMFSNLVKPAVGIIAERFAYIPSLGFCIVLGWGVYKLLGLSKEQEALSVKQKSLLKVLAAVFILSSLVYVFNRNNHWDTEVSLASHDIQYLEKSSKANALLGDFLLSEMQDENSSARKKLLGERAAYYYNQSAEIFPDWDVLYHNLGVIYIQLGKNKEAVPQIKKAIELGRKAPNTYYNLGLAYMGLKNTPAAITQFEAALAEDSGYLNAYSQLIKLNIELQNYDRVFDLNIQALKKFPERAAEIIANGQEVCDYVYGVGSTYYIDRLNAEGLVEPQDYQKYVQQLRIKRNTAAQNQQ